MAEIRLFSRRYCLLAAFYSIELLFFIIILSVAILRLTAELGLIDLASLGEMPTLQDEVGHLIAIFLVSSVLVLGIQVRWEFIRYLWPAWVISMWGSIAWTIFDNFSEYYAFGILFLLYPAFLVWMLFFTNRGKAYFASGEIIPHELVDEVILSPITENGRHLRNKQDSRVKQNWKDTAKLRGYWIGAGMIAFGDFFSEWFYIPGFAIIFVSFLILRDTRRPQSSLQK